MICASEFVKVALRNSLTRMKHVTHDCTVIYYVIFCKTLAVKKISPKNVLHEAVLMAVNYNLDCLESRATEWVVNTQSCCCLQR
jgi:hypothetical protein